MHCREQLAVLVVQKTGCQSARTAEGDDHDRKQQCEQSAADENPLPAREPEPAVEVEQGSVDRPADHVAEAAAQREEAQHAYPVRVRKPGDKVVNHAGIDAGLGRAQQQPEDAEHVRRSGERQRQRDEAAAENQQCQPAPRTVALQRQATRYLEHHIAYEEQRCRETECCLGNVQVREHLQFGEADVLAVDEGDQKHQDQHRHQAPAEPTHQGLFVFRTVHAANCPVRAPAMRLCRENLIMRDVLKVF